MHNVWRIRMGDWISLLIIGLLVCKSICNWFLHRVIPAISICILKLPSCQWGVGRWLNRLFLNYSLAFCQLERRNALGKWYQTSFTCLTALDLDKHEEVIFQILTKYMEGSSHEIDNIREKYGFKPIKKAKTFRWPWDQETGCFVEEPFIKPRGCT